MMHKRKIASIEATAKELLIEKYRQLTPEQRRVVDDKIARMFAEREPG